jgi:hypothetical protein
VIGDPSIFKTRGQKSKKNKETWKKTLGGKVFFFQEHETRKRGGRLGDCCDTDNVYERECGEGETDEKTKVTQHVGG